MLIEFVLYFHPHTTNTNTHTANNIESIVGECVRELGKMIKFIYIVLDKQIGCALIKTKKFKRDQKNLR